ncbi:MAG: hypothetical protein ACK522_07035, partial [Synechococcaceae cyanobacterium]
MALNWGIFSQHFWGEFTQQLQERAGFKALAPALDFTALHDKGFALATLLALHEAPICAALAAAEAGASRPQAERLADVLLVLLWQAMNRHADDWG